MRLRLLLLVEMEFGSFSPGPGLSLLPEEYIDVCVSAYVRLSVSPSVCVCVVFLVEGPPFFWGGGD